MEERFVSLEHFIERFPVARLPITLNEASQRIFSAANEPFNQLIVDQYLIPLDGIEVDEYTEFVPCFRIPDTHEFHAIVYWKAELLNYQFILATLSKKGELIDKKVIAGTYYDGQVLVGSVATIDEDWEILIISGKTENETIYDASSSTTTKLELLPEGQIINIE
jgi:hypothetical protein